jgi:hypothetical protein
MVSDRSVAVSQIYLPTAPAGVETFLHITHWTHRHPRPTESAV